MKSSSLSRDVAVCVFLWFHWTVVTAFVSPQIVVFDSMTTTTTKTSTSALFGTRRKARRQLGNENVNQVKKKGKGKGKGRLMDWVDDDEDSNREVESTSTATATAIATPETTADSDRPEVSRVVVDEQTGIEYIEKGKAITDVTTGKAVALCNTPELRLAQMFPGVAPATRQEHRLEGFFLSDDNTDPIADAILRLEQACRSDDDGDNNKLPPHPQVTNRGVDFVLANRDLLTMGNHAMSKTLGRLKLRAQSLKNLEEARRYQALWKHYLTIESHLGAPFRQFFLNAEQRVGPNFGNLELTSFVGKETYERAASYLLLKSQVCHWEKKLQDAAKVEDRDLFDESVNGSTTPAQLRNNPNRVDNNRNKRTPGYIVKLCTGDPKRYLPNPKIIFRYDQVLKIVAMAQQMVKIFVEDDALFADLPAEVRFLETALRIQGGTALRKYAVEEFCPSEQINTAALREGLRRLDAQLATLPMDPYGDLKNVVGRLTEALAFGANEEPQGDPYNDYLVKVDGPGSFQTYTFNHDQFSLVRFLDNVRSADKASAKGTSVATSAEDVLRVVGSEAMQLFGINSLLNPDDEEDEDGPIIRQEEDYVVPERRALGRPHNVGWLDLLKEKDPMNDETNFESDNWREVLK